MSKKRRRLAAMAAAMLLIGGGLGYYARDYVGSLCQPGVALPPASAAETLNWAKPMDVPPLRNFYKIDDTLYRGAQPDAAGMRKLKDLGIKTVVNLRSLHDDKDEIGQLDLASEHIRIDTFRPEMDELVRFLEIVTDPARQPVFVHCQRGIDRTGAAVVAYRVVVCKWTKTQAMKEMLSGPFGYDHAFPNVPNFLDRLDYDELRRRLAEKQKSGT